METKDCTKCEKNLPLNSFYKTKFINKKDGKIRIESWCKFCTKNRALEYKRENRKIEYSNAWWSAKFDGKKQRAKNRGILFNLTKQEYKDIVSAYTCFYCKEITKNKTIDRKNNSLGYTKPNCVMSCSRCNSRKGTKTIDQMNKIIEIKSRTKVILPIEGLTGYHWELVLRKDKPTNP